MKTKFISLALIVMGSFGAALAQQPAKEDIKDAGKEIKKAGEATGRAAKKTGTAAKKTVKKGVNKSADAVEDTAKKVKDKTDDDKKTNEFVEPQQAHVLARRHPRAVRVYRCRCGRPVFFRNSSCLACNTPLGYEPAVGKVYPLTPSETEPGFWRVTFDSARPRLYARCGNLDSPSACNWIFPKKEADRGVALCRSCRLNRTIPDLSNPENQQYWHRIELAKRRLVSSLVAMRLPVASRVSEDAQFGLAFDLLRPAPGAPVQTGHDDGIITLNVEEADDSIREALREQMREPYRTLLGHLRHETGHYYWDRLISSSAWLEGFRELFGDERRDYGEALKQYYEQGAPADWQQHFVSAYATAHPWEDWAETWAHYLHLVDTLDTAFSFQLDIEAVELPFEAFGLDSLARPEEPNAAPFLQLLNTWARFTAVLNELSRSMGLRDFYPFILSRDAVAKLHFVHTLVESNPYSSRKTTTGSTRRAVRGGGNDASSAAARNTTETATE